ncbi:hypothetical protein L5G32_13185 [Gordonia sp. HY002]|uniref:hypothetical protein n=1 Tax=Gordonia zhenghanii TaxID=2911516 RepID=UPI001EEFE1F0|nr:hypothetical protein [Gordonia zhenghanii]MCF8571223.1 hypothetical protein [Gordonia zhenghanii]MCF8601747.1 hypothetical protein [Gordonia zhenghanii]
MTVRARWVGVLALVITCGLSACAADQKSAEEPAAVLGWVVGDGCGTPVDRVKAEADGLVARGVADAGYRSLYVACDAATKPAALDDPALHGYLDERGLNLSVVPPNDEAVDEAMRADTPLPALRTAITRHVMAAQPLVFSGEVALLDDAHVATVANRDVLAIGRDGRRTAGAPIQGDDERYSRAIGSQGLVVSLTNGSSSARDLSFDLTEVNLAGDDIVAATDVWTGRRVHASGGTVSVPVASTDSALLRIG